MHSWASGAVAMQTPTLCALRNGGENIVGTEPGGNEARIEKSSWMPCSRPDQRSGKRQGEQIVSQFSPLPTPPHHPGSQLQRALQRRRVVPSARRPNGWSLRDLGKPRHTAHTELTEWMIAM